MDYRFYLWICIGAIVLLIIFICAVIKDRSDKKNKPTKIEEDRRELEPIYNKLRQNMKNEYEKILSQPSFSRESVQLIFTKDVTSLYYEDSHTFNQIYEIWKNKEYLCILTNFDREDEVIRSLFYSYSNNGNMSIQDKKKALEKDYNRLEPKIFALAILIKDIEYFAKGGEKYTTMSVTGGGGSVGGSSIKGAIVGGAIAGSAGAIIGSRKKTTIDPVKTVTTVHDETESYIVYKDGDSIRKIISRTHSEVFYNALRQVIPEKEYAYVMAKQQIQSGTSASNEKTIEDKLDQLKTLLDKELISEEEYKQKRKDLIDSM